MICSARHFLGTLASFGGRLRKVHGVTIDPAGDLPHRKGYIVRLTPAAPLTLSSTK